MDGGGHVGLLLGSPLLWLASLWWHICLLSHCMPRLLCGSGSTFLLSPLFISPLASECFLVGVVVVAAGLWERGGVSI